MTTNLYRGFSTVSTTGPNTAIHDRRLVDQDILNVFNTPLGSRVGRGRYGSVIPGLEFELGNELTDRLIDADVNRNINADPRVRLIEKRIEVDLDQHTVIVHLLLDYIELDTKAWATIPIRLRDQ